MNPDFLKTLFARNELMQIISQTFVSTISQYTHSPISTKPAQLNAPIDRSKIQVAGLIRYDSPSFGLELLLQFPPEVIFYLYRQTFQSEINTVGDEAKDLAGELLNIAFGTIDPSFVGHGIKMRSSFPKTFASSSWKDLEKKIPTESILIPLTLSTLDFQVEIFPLGTFAEKWAYTNVRKN